MSIRENERRVEQRAQNAIDDQVMTFLEWCAGNRISPRNGRRIIASPGGPLVTQLSARRIGITIKNNRDWQASKARP